MLSFFFWYFTFHGKGEGVEGFNEKHINCEIKKFISKENFTRGVNENMITTT